MRNMSFALTKEQIREQTKFVTRRFGWWGLKPGDRIQPVEKCMGLKKGENMIKIGCPIEIVSVRRVSEHCCYEVTQDECVLEGFPRLSPDEFFAILKKLQKKPGMDCNRIEFRYVMRKAES